MTNDQGVQETRDLVGLEMADLGDTQRWEPEVAMYSIRLHLMAYACFLVLQVRDYIEKLLDTQIAGEDAQPPCVVEDNGCNRQVFCLFSIIITR